MVPCCLGLQHSHTPDGPTDGLIRTQIPGTGVIRIRSYERSATRTFSKSVLYSFPLHVPQNQKRW